MEKYRIYIYQVWVTRDNGCGYAADQGQGLIMALLLNNGPYFIASVCLSFLTVKVCVWQKEQPGHPLGFS